MVPRHYRSFVALAALLLVGGSDAEVAPRSSEGSVRAPTSGTTDQDSAPQIPVPRDPGTRSPDARGAGVPAFTANAAEVEQSTRMAVINAPSSPALEADGPAQPTAGASSPEPDRVASANPDRDRRYRRRYRNRYPGPIPTPADWEPPEGPVRIGLQAGHWRAHEAPSELSGLKDNGTRWNDVAEWEANLGIARRAATMLEEAGYAVDILPAVVPPGYRAHLFISIHADGSGDPRASGYRVASPRRDATGRAGTVASLLQESYGEATGIRHLTSATRRMRNYYAFNFRRYEHALHPMTIAVILETGFLTSARDRTVILDDPDRAARGIVEAVRAFPVTALPAVAAETTAEPTVPSTATVDPPTVPPQPLTSSPPSDPGRPGARRPGS